MRIYNIITGMLGMTEKIIEELRRFKKWLEAMIKKTKPHRMERTFQLSHLPGKTLRIQQTTEIPLSEVQSPGH